MNLEFTRSTLLVGSRCLTSILAITSGTLVHSALKFLLLPMPQEWRRAGSSKTAYTSTKWASHVTVLTTTSRKRSAEASETTSPSPKGPWKESGTSTSNSIEMCASSSTLLSWGKTIKKTGPISYLKTAFKAGNFSKSYSSREKTTNSTRRAPFPTTNSMNSSIATSISGTKASNWLQKTTMIWPRAIWWCPHSANSTKTWTTSTSTRTRSTKWVSKLRWVKSVSTTQSLSKGAVNMICEYGDYFSKI